jgi:hypothetical protein
MPMIFFYFLKIIFDISTSKRSNKYKPHLILAKKKNLKFSEKQVQPQSQTGSKSIHREVVFVTTQLSPPSMGDWFN